MRKTVVTLVVALACGLFSSVASADTIVVSPSPMLSGGGPFTWLYSVSLAGISQINNGDFFTIFDFAGFVPGSQTVIPGWTATSALVGACPAQDPFPELCADADDPSVANLTWTRTGGVILGPGANLSTPLGNFGAMSEHMLARNDFWTSQDQDNQTSPPTPGEGAGGNTNVPGLVGTPLQEVPEPASLLLIGSGLLGLAAARRRWLR